MFQYTPCLTKESPSARKMKDALHSQHRIETLIWKRHLACVPFDEANLVASMGLHHGTGSGKLPAIDVKSRQVGVVQAFVQTRNGPPEPAARIENALAVG